MSTAIEEVVNVDKFRVIWRSSYLFSKEKSCTLGISAKWYLTIGFVFVLRFMNLYFVLLCLGVRFVFILLFSRSLHFLAGVLYLRDVLFTCCVDGLGSIQPVNFFKLNYRNVPQFIYTMLSPSYHPSNMLSGRSAPIYGWGHLLYT